MGNHNPAKGEYSGNFNKPPHKRFQEELNRRHQQELGKAKPGGPVDQYFKDEADKAKKILDDINKRHPPLDPPPKPPGNPKPPGPPKKPPTKVPPGQGGGLGKTLGGGLNAWTGAHLGFELSKLYEQAVNGRPPNIVDESQEQDALNRSRHRITIRQNIPITKPPFRGGQIPGQLYLVNFKIDRTTLYGEVIPTYTGLTQRPYM